MSCTGCEPVYNRLGSTQLPRHALVSCPAYVFKCLAALSASRLYDSFIASRMYDTFMSTVPHSVGL
jgi:hypothetical protein